MPNRVTTLFRKSKFNVRSKDYVLKSQFLISFLNMGRNTKQTSGVKQSFRHSHYDRDHLLFWTNVHRLVSFSCSKFIVK